MNIEKLRELRDKIRSGELIYHEHHVYTPEQFEEYKRMKTEIEHYDLLQLTKKIQL